MELKGEPYPFSLCSRCAKLVDMITRGVLKLCSSREKGGSTLMNPGTPPCHDHHEKWLMAPTLPKGSLENEDNLD